MSYDVLVGDKSYNYNYNLGKLFAKLLLPNATPKPGIYALDGMPGRDAAFFINEALEEITSEIRRFGLVTMRVRYNAPNGWGDFDGAVMFLPLIGTAAAAKPKKKVRVM